MWFAEGHRPHPEPSHSEPMSLNRTRQEWLQSNPARGEALVDTGLSSAADCQKLHWSLGRDQQKEFSRLIARSVERDRALFESGDLEAEAKRITDLVTPVFKQAGLDPTTFGLTSETGSKQRTDLFNIHSPASKTKVIQSVRASEFGVIQAT